MPGLDPNVDRALADGERVGVGAFATMFDLVTSAAACLSGAGYPLLLEPVAPNPLVVIPATRCVTPDAGEVSLATHDVTGRCVRSCGGTIGESPNAAEAIRTNTLTLTRRLTRREPSVRCTDH